MNDRGYIALDRHRIVQVQGDNLMDNIHSDYVWVDNSEVELYHTHVAEVVGQDPYNKDLDNLEEVQVLFDRDHYFEAISVLFDKGLVPEGVEVLNLYYKGLLNQGDIDLGYKDQV